MRLCIICTGFSDEKGVSINSAKTIYEILENNKYINKIDIIFIDENKNFFLLKKEFLFSNTVEDFIHSYKENDCIVDYINYFKSFDKIFLTTHGIFGEDGGLQHLLEINNIKYIGPSEWTASNTFFKLNTLKRLWENNICKSWTSEIFTEEQQIKALFKKHSKLCIKPNNGGSSVGVKICYTFEDAMSHIEFLEKNNYIPLIEEVHEDCSEFSISLVNGNAGDPTEILTNGIFSYEKKYFPSSEVGYKNPANFSKSIIQKIKNDSIKIYQLFRCNYFLRIDGFYNKKNHSIIYTDLNTIPGFQLNGLFFKNQCHFDVMNELLCLPKKLQLNLQKKKKIYVIFGGDSSEQNVSIISGTNVIFNLTKDNTYDVKSFLLYKKKFWSINYNQCFQISILDFQYIIKDKKSMNLTVFLNEVKKDNAIIFNGLHGGIGENGVLQKIFEKNNIVYTGSNSNISKTCMNKYKTIKFIKNKLFQEKNLFFPKEIFLKNFSLYKKEELEKIWHNECDKKMFIKPNDDGCSVGSKVLESLEDFIEYHWAITNKLKYLGSLPLSLNSRDYLLQEYILTDSIISKKNNIIRNIKTNWFEGSIGTIGNKILQPSLCVTTGNFLTMEEKFLQGNGTNLTPIPEQICSISHIKIIKKIIKKIINTLNINTYCRIDYFYNIEEKKFILIEVNTLPALTPATVIFQQAIYEGLNPRLFLKKILKLALKK